MESSRISDSKSMEALETLLFALRPPAIRRAIGSVHTPRRTRFYMDDITPKLEVEEAGSGQATDQDVNQNATSVAWPTPKSESSASYAAPTETVDVKGKDFVALASTIIAAFLLLLPLLAP